MSQDNKSNEEVKSEGLAGILAAKQKTTIEVEKSLPDPAVPEPTFRVFNHRYEFKIDGKVLKPDAKNIYTPTSPEEFEFLRLQVERGLVHFY